MFQNSNIHIAFSSINIYLFSPCKSSQVTIMLDVSKLIATNSAFLKASILSLSFITLYLSNKPFVQRLTQSLLNSLTSEKETTKPKKANSNKTESKESKTTSLFPEIKYEDIKATDKCLVSCATDDSIQYTQIQTDDIFSWDLNDISSFQFEQPQQQLSKQQSAISTFPLEPTFNTTNSSLSPVDTYSDASPLVIEDPSYADLYNSFEFELPALEPRQKRNYSNDECYTPPPELADDTFSFGSSSNSNSNNNTSSNNTSTETSTTNDLFDSNLLDTLDPMSFIEDEQQRQLSEPNFDLFGDSTINIPTQPLPNGVYPATHSRSNSETNIALDFNLSQMDLEKINNSMSITFGDLNFNHPENKQIADSPSTASSTPSVGSHIRTNSTGSKIGHPFQCPHCSSSFRIRGYLTRHMKKHAVKKAYSCPFYCDSDKTPCHPSGGFSRRDTYKTHLKARHFLYPPGTRSHSRGKVSGICSACGDRFDSNENWVEEHIHNRKCVGLPPLHLNEM